jgi:hypothetical protein
MDSLLVQQTVKEFHRSRRMFAWIPSGNDDDSYPQGATLKIAIPDIPLSHREWIDTLDLGLDGQQLIRGYYMGSEYSRYGVYVYGPEFEIPESIIPWLRDHLEEFLTALNIFKIETPVYLGMDIGILGDQWIPKKDFGTIKTLHLLSKQYKTDEKRRREAMPG